MFCQDKYYCGHDHLNYAANIQVTIKKFKFIYKKIGNSSLPSNLNMHQNCYLVNDSFFSSISKLY